MKVSFVVECGNCGRPIREVHGGLWVHDGTFNRTCNIVKYAEPKVEK